MRKARIKSQDIPDFSQIKLKITKRSAIFYTIYDFKFKYQNPDLPSRTCSK